MATDDTTFFSLPTLGLPITPDQYLTQWLSVIQATYPDYTPADGNLEYLMAQIIASWMADLGALCSTGATEIFRQYGQTLIGLAPLDGASAAIVLSITTATPSDAIAVTSGSLTSGVAITSIPVTALATAIAAGTIVLIDGSFTQSCTTTGASAGDTTIAVSSVTPSHTFPSSSTITGTLSYSLPTGTQFDVSGYGFQTITPVSMNSSTTASVLATAVDLGTQYNGAGSDGSAALISPIDWVTSVTTSAGAGGGVDAEDDISYLNRLKATLRTMAQRPITAIDFATMARNFQPMAGTDQQEIGRAAAIDGATLTSPVEKTVYLYVTDADGNALNADTLTALDAWLQTLREVNFVVSVNTPAYQAVYVAVQVVASPGWDHTTVATAIQSALLAFLSPAQFGQVNINSANGTWATEVVKIYRSQVESVIQQVPGVDHIVVGSLKFDSTNPPVNSTADFSLTGTATLPTSTTVTVPTSRITFA